MSTRAYALGTFFLFACAGPDSAQVGSTAQSVEAQSICVSSFHRQRDCTDSFIPALVDARVAVDVPPGIRAAGQGAGREELIKEALEEWKADSQDGAIGSTCEKMMNAPAGRERSFAPMKACLEKQRCEEFVPCEIAVISAELSAR